ncbi:MAG: sigma-70 family RNA polymerase sigma factor [Clostridia bacterium]|nr:sigma-70 family RNA polymerase sigma factor [Clostridia bacterium]
MWNPSNEDIQRIRNLAKILGVRDNDLDDVVGEVLLAIVNRGEDLAPIDSIYDWCFVVIIHSIYRAHKERKKREGLIISLERKGAFFQWSGDIIEEGARKNLLMEAIDELDQRSQKIICLYYQYGYSIKEIALAFKINENTVKTIKARAIKTLRRRVGKQYGY